MAISTRRPSPRRPSPRWPKATLLVVEDNPASRDALCAALADEGFEVVPASDGEDALRCLRETPCDLVLLDVMLPGRTGLEVLDAVRRRFSALELPAIMVTARADSRAIVEALDRGANDFVAKPIDMGVLLARLATHLDLKRLAARHDEMVHMASHDLRKPLELIVDIAGTLRDRLDAGEPAGARFGEALGHVVRTGRYLSGVLEGFLDLESLEAGRVPLGHQPVDVNALVLEVRHRNAPHADAKRADVVLDLGELPSVEGDGVRLQQVIDNLLGNALKFSAPGSRTVVRTARADGGLVVEVVDAGPGLTDDDFRQVFRKFPRMSGRPTGDETSTGLGLAICRRIVELHGGEIGVRNNADRGATFWFRLPSP